MQQELKLKFFNSKLQIGFNFPSRIYDMKNECWIEGKVHPGRLVYGKQRIPYTRISSGIDLRNKIVHEYLPF